MGFTFADRRGHFYHAIPAASAYALLDLTDQMLRMGLPLEEMHAVGDGARSCLWRRIRADVTGLPLSIAEAAGLATQIKENQELHPNTCAMYGENYQISHASNFSLLPVLEHAVKTST